MLLRILWRSRRRRRIVIEFPAVEFVSDARRVRSPSRKPDGTPDPEVERRSRVRRGALLLVLGMLVLAGGSAALFADRGYMDVRRSRAELEELRRDLDRQLDRVIELKREVQRLEADPAAIERVAREELGLGRRGEIQFLLPRRERSWRDPGAEEPEGGPERP